MSKVAKKETPASKATKCDDSDRIQLVKALNTLEKTQSDFVKAVACIESMKVETVNNYTLQVDDLKRQQEELKNRVEADIKLRGDELELTFSRRSEEIKNTLKNSQIEVDQTLKEYRRDGAIELLAGFGEVPMNEDELAELKESILTLETQHTSDVSTLKSELEKTYAKEKAIAVNSIQLAHKAEIAQLTAENDMNKREMDNLRQIVADLKLQVREQQQLTRDVAESSRQGAISQSFGKNN